MATTSIRGITFTALLLSILAAAAGTQPAWAASAPGLPVVQHIFKFYLDPNLVTDMAFAKAVLPRYVADMNTVLAKNTRRQLLFDPETGILLTSTKPQSDSAPSPLPAEGFEIWAHATRTTYVISYGGYAGIDTSGAGVLAGLNWTRIYDPDHLNSNDLRDYTTQINNMLHELAHVMGAGMGEYYSLATIHDMTGTEPLLNINVSTPADPYWSDKPDFMADPLLRLARASTRADYLAAVQFSALTAAIFNGDYRNGIHSLDGFTVQVLDENGQPAPGAEVKVWMVRAVPPYTAQLTLDDMTDAAGQVSMLWGGLYGPHNAGNLLRLIKVYKDGVAFTPARYISVFDLDIAQLVNGESAFTVTMQPADRAPGSLTLSNRSINENEPVAAFVGTLAAADPDARDTVSFSFCGGADDASFQLDGSNLLSTASFDYELKPGYSLCLRADDGRGGVLDQTFAVEVNDLPDTTTATFTSVPANDGWVLESGKGSNKGGSLDAGSSSFLLGNDAANRRYRSVLAFKTSMLPDNAIITRVSLKTRRQAVTGDPFASLGSLWVDMGKPLIGSGAALQAADFQAQAGLASAGVFDKKADSAGWYSAKISPSAYSLVNLGGATQLRLQFSGKGRTGAAFLKLFSGNAAAANRPVLTVEYEIP